MNAVIVCESCKKPLTIPAEGLGKKVRCPACKTVFIGRRDEFKPRSSANGEAVTTATPPPPPANDAILSEEDVAGARSADGFGDAPKEGFSFGDDDASPRRTVPPKKKSYLWLIVLLVCLVLGLPALGCAGLILLTGGLLMSGSSVQPDPPIAHPVEKAAPVFKDDPK